MIMTLSQELKYWTSLYKCWTMNHIIVYWSDYWTAKRTTAVTTAAAVQQHSPSTEWTINCSSCVSALLQLTTLAQHEGVAWSWCCLHHHQLGPWSGRILHELHQQLQSLQTSAASTTCQTSQTSETSCSIIQFRTLSTLQTCLGWRNIWDSFSKLVSTTELQTIIFIIIRRIRKPCVAGKKLSSLLEVSPTISVMH